MTKVVSEDALKARLQGDRRDGRRGLACAIISPFACSRCLPNPGSSIVDATTKPLYGHREGAVLGDNPKKPADETIRRNPPKKPAEETRTSEPLLSHLFDGLEALGFGCRRRSWRRACAQTKAHKACRRSSTAFRATSAGAFARRLRLRRRRRHARGGGAPTCLSLQTASDQKRAAHDREAFRARMDRHRSGVLGQKARAVRLEGWSRERRAIVLRRRKKRGHGAFLRGRERGGAAFLRRDRRGGLRSAN